MSQEHECEEGTACAIDFTQENSPKKTVGFNKKYRIPAISLILVIVGIGLDYYEVPFFNFPVSLIWFGIIYLTIGGPIVVKALKLISKGKIYNEFVLMSVATIGAFIIGSYAEGVAVMLFYIVGELFQEAAVNKAKQSIEALLKVQVERVSVVTNEITVTKHPKEVLINEIILVKPGEKIALDGILLSDTASLNTAALTGESKPDTKIKGETVLAGMINLNTPISIQVTSAYEDTKLSKILKLVQEAVSRKAKTQKLISKLAAVYTPIVFWLAVALLIIPYFVMGNAYDLQMWLERALIFLVISCPCALVISIPLGYFGGIGASSRNGILFKGSNYLDLMTRVDAVVMDKTGTLTQGVFEVQEVISKIFTKDKLLLLAGGLEKHSTHPIAEAVMTYISKNNISNSTSVSEVKEIAGQGMKGIVNGYEVLAGNTKLLDTYSIGYDKTIKQLTDTVVAIAVNGKFAGYITLGDRLKDDAQQAISDLRAIPKIKEIVMLSGDKQAVVDKISSQLGLTKALGELLPEDKITEVEKLKKQGYTVAFVGDGINDAPVITLSDVGMAMGGLGSDAAIETADVIIQTDQPSKIATAIKIGNATKNIIWQNIVLALGIKILVLILGALGMATMWEAVIADVGVALLAILNAVRIQRMRW